MNNRVLLKKLVGENPGPRPDIEAINGIFKIKQIIPKGYWLYCYRMNN